MALPTYSTGTASVAAGGTVVTGVGGLWSGTNVKQGDFISIGGSDAALITEVTDATHLKVAPWTAGAKTTQPYIIYQNYVGRVVGVAAAEDVGTMLEKLHTDGLPFIVDPGLTAPDPSYGDDGQFAFQPTTGKWWTKTGGVWVLSPGLTSDNTKVLKAGDTMTGNLVVSKDDPSIVLAKTASGQSSIVYGYRGVTSIRWGLALGDASAETGSNAGSNFAIYNYNDAGTFVGAPLTINRTTGATSLTGNLSISKTDPAMVFVKAVGNNSAAIYCAVGTKNRWEISPGDNVAETGANVGCNFGIYRFDDAGNFISTALYIQRNTGDVILSNDLTWAGVPWTTYTPTVTVTGGAGTATGRYKRLGKTVMLEVLVNVTSGGSAVNVTIPPGLNCVDFFYLIGRERASTGFTYVGQVVGGSFQLFRYDNISAVTTGWAINLSGTFEVN